MQAESWTRARSLGEGYVESLACSVGAVTATELARLSGGQLSHDQITRALAGPAHGARELWAKVKPLVRAAEKEADGRGVLKAARQTGTIAAFVGLLADRTTKVATIEEINAATAQGWAGKE